jgi:hypothetical protein
MRFNLLLLLYLFVVTLSRSQSCTNVSGLVLDASTQEPLPGANVRLRSHWQGGASTNADGNFTIAAKAGDTLVVSFVGYREQEVIVSTACIVQIQLQEYTQLTGEVVVRAERLIAEEFRVMKADKLQIYTNPAAKADPLLAVNSMPSATTLDESANISLRGSTSQETGIFFNNVPIYDGVRYGQLNGIGTFSIFNTALINNVQVFAGNPPLEYGNTSSGLIALQTDNVISKKAATQVSITLANVGVSTQLPIRKKSSFSVFSNYQFSNFIRGLNAEALKRIKKFGSTDLGLYYFSPLSEKSSLRIFNYTLRENFTFDFQHPSFQGDFIASKTRNFTTASFQQRLGKGELNINQGFSFSASKFAYSLADIQLDNRDVYSSINYFQSGKKWDIKVGASHDNRWQRFAGTLPALDFAIAPTHPFISLAANTRIPLTESFGYAKFRITDKLMVGSGIRKNIPINQQHNYLSWQGNLKWQQTESFSWLLGAGRYHRTDFSRDENPTVLFQTDQLSLDGMYQKQKWEWTVSAFAKRTTLTNQTRETLGVEGFVKYQWGGLLAQISISSLRSTIAEADGLTYSSPFDLSYFGRANFQYRFAGSWTVSVFSLFRQGSFYQPVANAQFNEQWQAFEPTFVPLTNQQRLPAYFNMSMNISKLFTLGDKVGVVAFASMDNVTNHENVRAYNYSFNYQSKAVEPFAKRTFFVGWVANF